MRILSLYLFSVLLFFSCTSKESAQKQGLSVEQLAQNEDSLDSTELVNLESVTSRPSTVLLTGHADHRLLTVYRLMKDSGRGGAYLGSNYYYQSYVEDEPNSVNAWHGHYMPGIEAVYGSNMLNIAHYNMKTKAKNDLFEHPVVVNSLYFPSFETDTLNGEPVLRSYYLVSVYDEDTNKDKLVNYRDLRRFYSFDLEGSKQAQLIPANYSVISSTYDSKNDAMFVFASLDTNTNGTREEEEPIHVFWFSLKTPGVGERVY